jgi:hypothetical protein
LRQALSGQSEIFARIEHALSAADRSSNKRKDLGLQFQRDTRQIETVPGAVRFLAVGGSPKLSAPGARVDTDSHFRTAADRKNAQPLMFASLSAGTPLAFGVFMNDLKLAFRSLRSAPAVSLVAIASLALAIGASTALFSLINGLAYRTLPVANPIACCSLPTSRNPLARGAIQSGNRSAARRNCTKAPLRGAGRASIWRRPVKHGWSRGSGRAATSSRP